MILTNDWQRVLLICPHPDDETLGAGIFLQEAAARRAKVRVVYLTNGDRNPIAQLLHDGEWPLTARDRERFGHKRRQEAIRALEVLGVPPEAAEFWHYADQRLRESCRPNGAAEARMIALMADFRPTLVVAPTARDLHPDHVAAAWLTRRAIQASGITTAHLTYRVHGELEHEPAAIVFADSSHRQESKLAAMHCHQTQLAASRARMLQLAARDELLHEWDAESALPPVRFRTLRRLMHLLPSYQPAATAPADGPELATRA